jgi:AcrR family transcriptional regulator
MMAARARRTARSGTPPARRPAVRDRAATEARILEAARRIIAAEGFGALGVNALAAEAGCDKKLITRYFDGIEGVVTALGGDLGFWVGLPAAPAAASTTSRDTYGERMLSLLQDYAAALRGNALLQRVLAWELVAPSPALAALERARSNAVGRWMQHARGELVPPQGVDAPAVNAVLLAALHYLTLREQTLPTFAGLDIASPAGRARIDAALAVLLAGAYASSKRAGQ